MLLVAVGALAARVLAGVLATVVFAITVAYVLYPVRRALVERGFTDRRAAALTTSLAFAAMLALVAPVSFVLYRRRTALLDLLRSIPARIPVTVGEFRYVVETGALLNAAQAFVTDVGATVALALPVLTLKLMVFVLLVYGLLYKPRAPRSALLGMVPPSYHDLVLALHEQARATLLAIYVLQAATALGTAVIGFFVFVALGYDSAFTLAVVAGVLQFVPVVGPSVLVLALAVVDLVAGDTTRAALVVGLGLLLVGFLPDAVIRTRLAAYTSDLPVSLYFVGFVGGVLTLGAIGFVVGPLVVALLVEVVALLAAERREEAAMGSP